MSENRSKLKATASKQNNLKIISQELSLSQSSVAAVIELLEQGASIPFIARYRKEKTGAMDEVAITAVRDRNDQLKALQERKKAILKSLTERDLLTQTLEKAVYEASAMSRLEDLYEKFRPKKRTRARMAREKGLEPLANALTHSTCASPEKFAKSFVSPEKEIHSVQDALAGARDIIAEVVNEDADTRNKIRRLFIGRAQIKTG